MKLKTLYASERTEKIYDSGVVNSHRLHASGSKRIIVAYFLFPRILDGQSKRGLQLVEQVASIDVSSDGHEAIHYNHWEDVRFVPTNQLEASLQIA